MSEKSESGFIRISEDVISTISGFAAHETHGIASMSSGISEGFSKRFNGKNMKKGVSVDVRESETAINLLVIVYYGTKIQDVCRDLQENVCAAVENMTGLRVVEVNVKVEGLVFKEVKTEDTNHVK